MSPRSRQTKRNRSGTRRGRSSYPGPVNRCFKERRDLLRSLLSRVNEARDAPSFGPDNLNGLTDEDRAVFDLISDDDLRTAAALM